MSAHTPGPWQIDNNNCHSGQVAVCHGDEEGYVEVWSENWSAGISQSANARLIAAAPDLLKALQGLLASVQRGVCDGSGMEQDAARVAIAKAVPA